MVNTQFSLDGELGQDMMPVYKNIKRFRVFEIYGWTVERNECDKKHR